MNVSCSCHTAQLVLKDLYECDTYYQKLVEILKGISLRISYLSKEDITTLCYMQLII